MSFAVVVLNDVIFLQVTEADLREQFSQYGEIEDIKILTRPNNKRLGVAFLQFNLVQSAAKAIHYANMKPLLERAMIVDWAVPKDKFCQNATDAKSEIKTETIIDENEAHDTSEVKIEDESESDAELDRYFIYNISIVYRCIFFCITLRKKYSIFFILLY